MFGTGNRSALLRRGAAVGTVLVTVALGLTIAAVAPAGAATQTRYVAQSGSDTGGDGANDCLDSAHPCLTVQHAVDEAAAGDTVSVGAGAYAETVRITQSLTLSGAGPSGADKTSIQSDGDGDPGIEVDGSDADTPPVVTISDLDVSDVADQSDGIDIDSAAVTVKDCTVSDNSGDGIDVEGALEEAEAVKPAAETTGSGSASVMVTGSSITGNGTDQEVGGEGIEIDGGATATIVASSVDDNSDGGVVVESGSASVATSTLDGNVGAGVVADGESATVSVIRSTVSNTKPFAAEDGADARFGGGVLVFPGGSGTVSTSTIADNTGQGVLSFVGVVTVSNSTITGTRTALDDQFPSGAVASDQAVPDLLPASHTAFPLRHAAAPAGRPTAQASIQSGAGLTVSATILAGNTAPDCAGSITDAGYNLADSAACDWTATGSIAKGVAKLGPLADNGGPTLTQLPAKGSAALDHIPSGAAGCSSGGTDQRGDPRLVQAKCDIGAVEVAQPPLVVTPSTLPSGTVGTAYSVTLQASGGLGSPYRFALAAGHLPAGLSLSGGGVISGTPTTAGTSHFTVAVDDPVDVQFVIVINGGGSGISAESDTVEPLAATGAPVGPLLGAGGAAVLLGLLILMLSTLGGASMGRHRRSN